MYKIKTFEKYLEIYAKSIEDPSLFWAEKANHFYWYKKWNTVLDWNLKSQMLNGMKGVN